MSTRLPVQHAVLKAGYWQDDAIGAAGPAAELVFVRVNSWCAQSLTDGFVSVRNLRMVMADLKWDPVEMAEILVREDLWAVAEGGYTVVSYLKYNRSKQEIEDYRERDRARKTRSAPSPPLPPDSARKGARTPNGEPGGSRSDSVRKTRGVRTDSAVQSSAVQSSAVQLEEPPPTPRKRGEPKVEPEGFAEFYQAFPNHKDRAKAATSWAKLGPTDQAAAMAGVPGYAAYVEAEIDDPHKILHPATYLNNRRWEDEYRGPGRHLVPVGDGRPARIPTTTQRVAEIDALREKMLRGQG